jgi:hypothetical protein
MTTLMENNRTIIAVLIKGGAGPTFLNLNGIIGKPTIGI